MGNLFAKDKKEDNSKSRRRGERPPPSETSPQDKAILELKVQRDKLKVYQKKLAVVIGKETEIARALLAKGDKTRALVALRKKKYQESMLDKTDGMLLNLFEMVSTLEFTQVENDVLEGLKNGNDVLNQLHSEMSLDDVESLMSETEDAAYMQQQINEMLAGQLSEEDEDAVCKELDQLEQEVLGEEEGEEQGTPAVPTEVETGSHKDSAHPVPTTTTTTTTATTATTTDTPVPASAGTGKGKGKGKGKAPVKQAVPA
eukprot:TRINITY_DN744_c1_g1_i6.p1 TRINITY_DN744_c1_g1~~TRINITY_DN744_c1_g1_i6.p1  ORF type:complete len:258 (-),score=68.89 TRINITY_DN744_c1_g1_i6:664-1437(-)